MVAALEVTILLVHPAAGWAAAVALVDEEAQKLAAVP